MPPEDQPPTDIDRKPARVTSLAEVRAEREKRKAAPEPIDDESLMKAFVRSLSQEALALRLLDLAKGSDDLRAQLVNEARAARHPTGDAVAFVRKALSARRHRRPFALYAEVHAILERLSLELPSAEFVALVRDVVVTGTRNGLVGEPCGLLELAAEHMERLGWSDVECMHWFVNVDLALPEPLVWITVGDREPTRAAWTRLASELEHRFDHTPPPAPRLAANVGLALWFALREHDAFAFLLRAGPTTGDWTKAAELLAIRRNEPWCAKWAQQFLDAIAATPEPRRKDLAAFRRLMRRKRTRKGEG